MGITDVFKKPKTLDELQEEDDRLTVEKSVAEKRFAIAELRRRGQNPNNFKEKGKFNLQKAWTWLRSRKSH
jgi:hypothetical protein